MRDMVVLIDLDGACCRAMARKLRAEHIYCKILPATSTKEDILAQEALGILLAGGVTGELSVLPESSGLLATSLPLLAMGDAALAVCLALGGSLTEKEDAARVVPACYDRSRPEMFTGVEDGERYLQAPRFLVPPAGATPAILSGEQVLGFYDEDRAVYAAAFQVEQNDPDGMQLLVDFCTGKCGCTAWWSDQAFVDRAVEEIRRVVGDEGEAVCALSGGVDSGVCAVLGNMALGSRLHCIFVDTGLLRKDEGDKVAAFYGETVGLDIHRIDARDKFLTALSGIRSAQSKEEIIFSLLHDVLHEEMAKLGHVTAVLQGTNYNDALVKNTPFPLDLPGEGLRLVEPVRELFKDEIRRVGEGLGLPPLIIQRQPFPGSGLALRILSDVTEEKLGILREADAIFRGEIEESGQSKRLWQYFATLADNPAEDGRNLVVTLRAVQVCDGSAAMAARLPYDLLEKTVELIRKALPRVRRVVYDLTPSDNYTAVDWR